MLCRGPPPPVPSLSIAPAVTFIPRRVSASHESLKLMYYQSLNIQISNLPPSARLEETKFYIMLVKVWWIGIVRRIDGSENIKFVTTGLMKDKMDSLMKIDARLKFTNIFWPHGFLNFHRKNAKLDYTEQLYHQQFSPSQLVLPHLMPSWSPMHETPNAQSAIPLDCHQTLNILS